MIKNNTIVIDLDGSILNNNDIISNKDYKTLKILAKENSIVIATGRNYISALEIIKRHNLENIIEDIIVCSNGQELFDIKNNVSIYENFINYDMFKQYTREMKQNQIFWYIKSSEKIYSKKIIYNCKKYINNKNFILLKNTSELKKVRLEKIILNCKLSKSLNRFLNTNNTEISSMNKNRKKRHKSDFYWENILLPKGVNKYSSVLRVIELLDLSNNLISFGNGINDYELLKNSNVSICTNNSRKELKKISNYITCNNNDNPLTNVYENYFK